MKKFIAAAVTVFIAVALSLVAVAAPASAHTATLSGVATCNADGSATVTWTLDNDYNEVLNVTSSNDASIPVGTTVPKTNNGPDTTKTFTETIASPAGGKSVTADLNYEWSGDNFKQNGPSVTVKAPASCLIDTAAASVTLTSAGCGIAATVAENSVTNAGWTSSHITSTSYTIVATATSGYTFTAANDGGGTLSHGNTVDTFSGTLSQGLSADRCQLAAAQLTDTPATCDASEAVTEDTNPSDLRNATWAPISISVSNNVTSYSAVATANAGYTFSAANDGGGTLSHGNTVDTITGTLAPALSGHVCEDYIIVAWTMPSWSGPETPTWTQTLFAHQEQTQPNLAGLDSLLTEQCGVQYQVDIYYNSPTTTSLLAGGFLDGPNNPNEDLIPGGWGVAYKLVQGPACAPVTTPTETDSCSAGGSITIYQTPGVNYYFGGNLVDTSAGNVVESNLGNNTYTVTAEAQAGYLLTGYPDGGWSITVNANCGATFNSTGECTANNGISSADASLTFSNPSKTDATFTVTSTDGTSVVSGSGIYDVPAGTTETEPVGTTAFTGGTFLVSIDGGTPVAVVVPAYAGCADAIGGDPSVAQATCDGQTANNDASITIDLEAGLIYSITGPGTDLTNLSIDAPYGTNGGTAGDYVAATGLAAGQYVVAVQADTALGYVLDSKYTSENWPLTVTLKQTICDFGASAAAVDCNPTPPVNIQTGKLNADITPEPTITIVPNADVTYTAVNTTDNTSFVLTSTVTNVSDPGVYNVVVSLSSQGASDGFVLPVGGLTFGPFDLTSFCPPTLPALHVGATGSDSVCTDGTTTDGVITLVHLTGQTPDETGLVTYTITNTVTNQVVYTGNIATTVNVPAGSYLVHATVPSGDGISGNTSSNDFENFSIVIATNSTGCAGLAFTGGTIAWLGFVFAGGMLFLGIALLYIRRRGNRTAE